MTEQENYDQGYEAALEQSMEKLATALRDRMGDKADAIPPPVARGIFDEVFGPDASDEAFGEDPVVRKLFPPGE